MPILSSISVSVRTEQPEFGVFFKIPFTGRLLMEAPIRVLRV